MLDEIAIKKETQRSRDGKVDGHVDFGAQLQLDDNSHEAKNALVFMVVGVNSNWKLPIGYFLINGIESETSAELVTDALIQLHDVGVEVISLTLDGTSEHFATVKLLGANFDPYNLKPYFLHPINLKNIYVIFDACHMLKLIRNTFGDEKLFIDYKGNKIEWRYIKQLAHLQENEGLRAENELLFHSRRKVGFLGMYSAALAVIKIYEDYVKKSDAPLRHLLTYKLSQDYLELFFCAIRARSGWCPNPTCMQFKSSYKRLLIHHEVKGSNGNTTLQHKTKILTVSSGARKKDRIDRYDPEVYDAMVNLRVAKKYELTDGEIDPSRTKDILNVYSLPKKIIEPQFGAILCSKVLKELIANPTSVTELFPELNSHIFDDDVDDLCGHVFSLAKSIINKYIEIRMYALSVISTRRQNGLNARHYKNREMVWLHI
ncbi:thap domain-containing protein [Lasius niger]|uniref:Thap domain-containing protein n=1 Tax=Lasius niger TaxID=67767 RepID=A0A0J7KAT8_LASNI|nr:thap domain-containing protein [Lasius niger]